MLKTLRIIWLNFMKNLFGNCSFLNCGLMPFTQRDLSVTGFNYFTIKLELSFGLVRAPYPLLFWALWRIHAWLAIRISIRIAHLADLVILPKLRSLLVVPILNMLRIWIFLAGRPHLILLLHLLLFVDDHAHVFPRKALCYFLGVSGVVGVNAIVLWSFVILIVW